MSCKDCECSSHCLDAYTEVSHLCNNYEKGDTLQESEEKTMPREEFIKALVDIRKLCSDSDCEDCYYAKDKYHGCYFNGPPCEWDNLEELLKQESED